ncbi:unnamed protein product, partial [Allacma fusca]
MLGGIGFAVFWLLQRRASAQYRPQLNEQEAARVRGFVPANNRYARRNTIRAWLEDVMQQEGDAEDVALGRQVLDQLRANLANDALDQLRRQQVRA